MEGRNTIQSTAVHVYSRAENGFLLFYTISSFLVFFSIVCVTAKKRSLQLLGISPMYDHLHYLANAYCRKEVFDFIRDVESQYALELNKELGISGRVFHKSFGSSVKRGDKAVRNACSYNYNNPGEKGLCNRAEEYRWTFLAYANSKNPYSKPLEKDKATLRLRKAIKWVDKYCDLNYPLNHRIVRMIFKGLNSEETQQLIDYIIVSYNCIDYELLLSFYDNSYEKACLAFASNQGSEYNVKEEFVPGSHQAYLEIPKALSKYHGYQNPFDALKTTENERAKLLCDLMMETHASREQLRKYLRLPKID